MIHYLAVNVTVNPGVYSLKGQKVSRGMLPRILPMRLPMRPHTHTHTHIHTYIHTYIHLHTYTHTHTTTHLTLQCTLRYSYTYTTLTHLDTSSTRPARHLYTTIYLSISLLYTHKDTSTHSLPFTPTNSHSISLHHLVIGDLFTIGVSKWVEAMEYSISLPRYSSSHLSICYPSLSPVLLKATSHKFPDSRGKPR